MIYKCLIELRNKQKKKSRMRNDQWRVDPGVVEFFYQFSGEMRLFYFVEIMHK